MPPRARWRRNGRRILIGLFCALAACWVGLLGCRILYPLDYRDEIRAQSAVYRLDPALVAAVIRNESRFDPDALSSAGAVGLMQIMPDTGAWIASLQGIQTASLLRLEDPATNIALGAWYLRHLLDRFIDLDTALMAYNAGPTHAERWNGQLDQAFPETQAYVRRIRASLPVYRAYFAVAWLDDLVPSTRLWR